MSRTLAIISAVSLALCAVLFWSAWMIGGDAVFHDRNAFAGIKPLIDLATHKEWRWDGGDTLALDAPVNIRYQQSGPQRISVTGDADQLEHVRVGGGRIATDNAAPQEKSAKPRLEAVVSGMALRRFVVNGHQNLELGMIDQDQLDIEVHGSGSVSGSGHVKSLKLAIMGSGAANLAGLSVQDAKVALLGSGNATIAPHGKLELAIAGSGHLSLAARPANIQQVVTGTGGIRSMEPQEAQPLAISSPPAPPAPPAPLIPHGSQYNLKPDDNVDLGHIDQQSLSVTIPGSGKMRAEGRVDNLSVQVLGSGKVEFGKLAAGNVTVRIMGSGDVTIAPSSSLQVFIAGSGTVHLRTKPASLSQSILGSGRIVEDY